MADNKKQLPLSGVRILVGRARHQAGALSSELRKQGAEIVEIPFIGIRKPRSFKELDTALRNLRGYDWLILTSVNGVEAMWARLAKLHLTKTSLEHLRVAAIGPATEKAIEQRGARVDVVPEKYIAESVVHSLKGRVKGKRVLVVRAMVARDVIPRELRRAGARVDVVEAYETVLPRSSRTRLYALLKSSRRRPHFVAFTSSSTARNFVALLRMRAQPKANRWVHSTGTSGHPNLYGIRLASIGPITSSTLRELGLRVDVEAQVYTIAGLVAAIVRKVVERA